VILADGGGQKFSDRELPSVFCRSGLIIPQRMSPLFGKDTISVL
jgi:hypothetical protein